jgi:DNA-binding response OmpR family regulator
MKRVLVVADKVETAAQVIDILGSSNVEITFVNKAATASATADKRSYDVIILGDRLPAARGDVYDVALTVKRSRHNKKTPVICVGRNPSLTAKLIGLLRPYAFHADPRRPKSYSEQLQAWIRQEK